jgi:asparagine N-glycosylation enzyme membrane subunit Stt3
MIRGVQKRASAVSVILALLVIAILAVNFAEGYVYSNGITPSICFADSRILIDGQKCLVINEDGSYTYAAGQPWYEAMQFLDGTDKNSSVLSWWDFGYWFQTRGHKPSVADGGNIYTKKDHEIAEWFISPVSNWSGWVPWLEYHKVSHIFMDYTLPGKYGAISRIATNGAETRGFLQLSQSNVFTQNGKTIYEFKVGPYLIWLPISETGGVNGSPVFVVTQNDQYYSKQYINYVCTDKGVMRVGNETPSMGGCVALSKFGVFYIDEADKNSIFARLMFMEGYDLPLKKVFDNGYIIIYETGYNESGSSA